METITSSKGISRRELLKRCMVVGAGLAVGTGFVAGSTAAWAMETKHVAPREMATLIQMAEMFIRTTIFQMSSTLGSNEGL